MAERCKEKTKDGKPCKAFAVENSEFCWAHDPQLAKKRSQARSKGGRTRAYQKGVYPGDVANVDDVLEGLNAAIKSAWELDNAAERGRLHSSLYALALNVVRPLDIEERIAAIERSIGLEVSEHDIGRAA